MGEKCSYCKNCWEKFDTQSGVCPACGFCEGITFDEMSKEDSAKAFKVAKLDKKCFRQVLYIYLISLFIYKLNLLNISGSPLWPVSLAECLAATVYMLFINIFVFFKELLCGDIPKIKTWLKILKYTFFAVIFAFLYLFCAERYL